MILIALAAAAIAGAQPWWGHFSERPVSGTLKVTITPETVLLVQSGPDGYPAQVSAMSAPACKEAACWLNHGSSCADYEKDRAALSAELRNVPPGDAWIEPLQSRPALLNLSRGQCVPIPEEAPQ